MNILFAEWRQVNGMAKEDTPDSFEWNDDLLKHSRVAYEDEVDMFGLQTVSRFVEEPNELLRVVPSQQFQIVEV